MIRRAWCVGPLKEQTRLNIKIVQGGLKYTLAPGTSLCRSRALRSLHMVHEVLKRTSLRNTSLEASLYAADLSPDIEHGRRNPQLDFLNPHPILVYQKRTGDNNSIAFPEDDFYAQNWKEKRQSILGKSDQLSWGQRLPTLMYRGQFGGYRGYLNLSSLLSRVPDTDVVNTKR